ncbi:MAG: hypothetical protein DRQ65_03755, partial [Gammaproteobacteria bacterium]
MGSDRAMKPGKIGMRLLESVAIFLAIVASANVAVMMTISDQFLSPIWLPAAICLSALIWFGNRSIPAIVIATGFLGWLVARNADISPTLAILVVVGTAAGAILQAA